MRKFYFILMALFCAMTLFTGCSDDDDDKDKGNGQGAGNGGSGVEVLSKKIVKIESTNNGTQGATSLYAYDANGRLSKITETKGSNSKAKVMDFVYGDNKITITTNDDREASVIQLKDGRAVSYVEYDGTIDRYDYTYSYSGKYLSKSNCKDFTKVNSTWENNGSDETVYTVKDGNLVSIGYKYTSKDDAGQSTSTLEMSNTDNNTNIDLYGLIMYDPVFLLCTAGDRYKKLPAKVLTKEEGDKEYQTTYSYEVDKDSYVTKITETEDGGDSIVYTITYE